MSSNSLSIIYKDKGLKLCCCNVAIISHSIGMHPDIFQGTYTSHVLRYSLKQTFKLKKKSGCIAIAGDIMQAI